MDLWDGIPARKEEPDIQSPEIKKEVFGYIPIGGHRRNPSMHQGDETTCLTELAALSNDIRRSHHLLWLSHDSDQYLTGTSVQAQ